MPARKRERSVPSTMPSRMVSPMKVYLTTTSVGTTAMPLNVGRVWLELS